VSPINLAYDINWSQIPRCKQVNDLNHPSFQIVVHTFAYPAIPPPTFLTPARRGREEPYRGCMESPPDEKVP